MNPFRSTLGGVEVLEERSAGRFGDVTRSHRYGADAQIMAGAGRVDRVFGPDYRIVVREGDASTAALGGGTRDGLGSRVLAEPGHLARLGNVMILTEFAAEVAAGRAEREDARTREEVIERLLLDRVDAESGAAAIGREHHATVAILAYEAKPPIAGLEMTRPGTEIADHAIRLFCVAPPAAEFRPVGEQGLLGWKYDHAGHVISTR